MQWIDVEKSPPKDYMEAVVYNDKIYHQRFMAKYHPPFGLWLWRNPHTGESIALQITHYFPIPEQEAQNF